MRAHAKILHWTYLPLLILFNKLRTVPDKLLAMQSSIAQPKHTSCFNTSWRRMSATSSSNAHYIEAPNDQAALALLLKRAEAYAQAKIADAHEQWLRACLWDVYACVQDVCVQLRR